MTETTNIYTYNAIPIVYPRKERRKEKCMKGAQCYAM